MPGPSYRSRKGKKVTRVRKPVGVLAPGAKFNSKTGKITPKKKSSVFTRGLPKPSSQIPQAPRGLRSSPRGTQVTPSGKRSVNRYTKGTVEYNRSRAKARTPLGKARRQLEREERRQEALIKLVTGKPRQVELRLGVSTGGKVERFEGTALGNPKKGRSPSLIQGNLVSKDPQIVKRQKIALAQKESVRSGLESTALNERKLPFKKGYLAPGLPAPKAAKAPAVLKPSAGAELPKFDPRKTKLAKQMNKNTAKSETRVLRDRKKPLARRAKAADNLRELQVISGESKRRKKARQLREARAAVAAGNGVSFDSGYKTKGPGGAIKAVGKVAGAVFDYIRPKSPLEEQQGINVTDVAGGAAKALYNASKPKSPLEQAAQGDDVVTKVGKAAGKVAVGVVEMAANEAINVGKGTAAKPEQPVKTGGLSGKPDWAIRAEKRKMAGGQIAKVPGYAAEALYNDPVTQTERFFKDMGEMIKSAPAGVIMAADQGPDTVWQQIKKDYERRYGPLLKGRDKEFRDRLKKEGITSEVLDSFAVLSGIGATSGKALQAAATAGKGTGLARRIATRSVVKDGKLVPRKLGVRELRPSKNFYGNVARKVLDDTRGKGVAKRQRVRQEILAKQRTHGGPLTPAENRLVKLSYKDRQTTDREGGSTPIRTGTPRPAAAADLPEDPGKVEVQLTPASLRIASESLRSIEVWKGALGLKTRFPYRPEIAHPREHFSAHTDNPEAMAAVSLSNKIDLARSELGDKLPDERGMVGDESHSATPGGKPPTKGPKTLTLTRRESELLYQLQTGDTASIKKSVDSPLNPITEISDEIAADGKGELLYNGHRSGVDGFLSFVAERMAVAGYKSGAKQIQDFVKSSRNAEITGAATYKLVDAPKFSNAEMAAFSKAQQEAVTLVNEGDGSDFYKEYGIPERFVKREIDDVLRRLHEFRDTATEAEIKEVTQAVVDRTIIESFRVDKASLSTENLSERSARVRRSVKSANFTENVRRAAKQDLGLNVMESALGRTTRAVESARGRQAHVDYLAREMGLTPESLSLIDAVTGRAEAEANLSVFTSPREGNFRRPDDDALYQPEHFAKSEYKDTNLGGMSTDEALRALQAIKDYFGSYLYYGTINNTLRSGLIDPDRIVSLTKTWDSNLVTEADLVRHYNDLVRMVNERGGQFHQSPIAMIASRVLPRNARLQLLNPDGSEVPFSLATDELKPGMVFANAGFMSTSIGLGDKAPWNNGFLSSKVRAGEEGGPADTAIIVEFPEGTPGIWSPQTFKLDEGFDPAETDLDQSWFGGVEGENEVVLAPGMRLEFVEFRKPDDLVADLAASGGERRGPGKMGISRGMDTEPLFWQRAVANHDLEQRYGTGEVAAPAASQQWKGVPVFRVIKGSGEDKIPYMKRPALSEGSFAKKRAASQAEIDRLTPIVDKQRADVKPLTKRERRKEDTRLGRQAESVSTIFDNPLIGESAYMRRSIAKISSLEFVAMRLAQSELDKLFKRELKKLSQEEKNAFFYAMSLGIRTPEQARAVLPDWRDRILKERKLAEAEMSEKDIVGGPIWKQMDEVPRLEALIKNPEAAFTEKLAKFTDMAEREARRTGKLDPSLDRFQMAVRERGVQAQQLGVKIEDYAVDAKNPTRAERENWIRAVEVARKEKGLAKGGFFRGERRDRQPFAVRAVGGSQAVLPDKQFKGILAKYGAGNTDPEVFVRGLMSNIKRRHNWNKVALAYDAVTDPLYRNMDFKFIQAAVENGDLDPKSFALWNPRKYRQELDLMDEAFADASRNDPEGGRALGLSDELEQGGQGHPEDGQTRVFNALTEATVDGPTALARYNYDKTAFADAKWNVIPLAAHKEIMKSTTPSGAFLRSVGILQGKFSRVLLANPVWLQFQMISNAFLTGLVDGTGPLAIYRAQKWWYGLPPEVRRAVEPYVGIHRWYDDQNKLGAAEFRGGDIGVGRMSLNGLVDSYRGLKTTKAWNPNINPLTAMFRADNAQNNFFRRAVLYNSIKRQTYRNMGRDMGQMRRIQAQVMDLFTGKVGGKVGDKDAMMKLLTNQKSLERHAEHLDSVLGNWMTYTNAERRILSRGVMFYGFMRFSTKLTFYTMPTSHPIMSSILLKLGQLQRDELRKMFGVDVPFWEIGNYYGTDGWLVPEGMRIQAARINPFFNAYGILLGPTREREATKGEPSFTIDGSQGPMEFATKPEFQGLDPSSIVQYMPPYFGMALDQITHMKTGLGRKPWTINSNPAYQTADNDYVGTKDQLQVLLNDVLNLSPYYRALEKSGIPGVVKPLRGKQTTDSSLLFPNPVKYSGKTKPSKELIKKNQTLINREGRNFKEEIAGSLFTPILGTDAQPKIDSARAFAKKKAKSKKKKKAKKNKLWTVPK